MATDADTKWYTIAGHRVAVERYYHGTFFDPQPAVEQWVIPALVGRDVNRYPGHVRATAPFVVERGEPLRGWGDLDCERSYRISGVNVPCELLEALARKIGAEIVERVDEE